MKIALPRKVMMIIKNLQLHGYEAYAVGGCVRDSILARRPKDWDITTSARPEEVKKLFRRTVDKGIEHGTVTVLLGRDGYEVTTYRIDGAYEDSRHPKEVLFTNRLEEDLRRRDFTINAMAYNDEVRLVDVFGGMQDLNHHLIRCVGDPRERFSEDALRYFQLGDVRSFIKQRLRQGSHGGGQELTRVDNHAPCTVCPPCAAAQRDGRIESGTCGIRCIESLCQRKFCATHVRTVGKHL